LRPEAASEAKSKLGLRLNCNSGSGATGKLFPERGSGNDIARQHIRLDAGGAEGWSNKCRRTMAIGPAIVG